MGELYLPLAIIGVTILVAAGCVAAARWIMARHDKLFQDWQRKHSHR